MLVGFFTPGEGLKRTGHELKSSGDVPTMDGPCVTSVSHESQDAAARWMLTEATLARQSLAQR